MSDVPEKGIIMRGYRISLIRHGSTEANEKGIYIGKTDYPLSEDGIIELQNKTRKFIYPDVDRVYASPLKRCVQSAEILFPDSQIQKLDDLRELDFGDFEGKSVDELIDKPEYKEWLKGGVDNNPPNGESIKMLVFRSYNAINEIVRQMMEEDILHCAVVTHAGIITNMLSCFGLPKIDPKEISCLPGEGFEILVTAQMWQVSNAFEILGMAPYTRDEE